MENRHDIISRINEKYAAMSKGHKAIATYIMEHYDQAAFMTAAKLGAELGISESTVVRFAAGLGYEGYPQMQQAIAAWVKGKLNTVDGVGAKYAGSTQSEILTSVLNSDIEKLRHTIDHLDPAAFETAVDLILSAKRVYILGIRSCEPLAGFLSFYLGMIRDNVIQIKSTSTSEIFEQMIRITEDDVVIGISFPRYSMRTMKALEFANSRKAKVITITDSVHSPMNVYAACTLIAKSDMASIVDSLVAPLSVINALVVALCMKRQADVKKTLESMEKLWDEYQVYSNDEINGLDDARPMGGKKAALPVKEKA